MALTIGLVGAGSISYPHVHAHTKNPNVAKVVVAEISDAARQRLCGRYGLSGLSDYRQLIDDPAIDLIDVCLPSHLHEGVSIEALRAGKHVICEKPPALSVEGTQRMIAAAHSAKRRLFGVLNQRFMPMHEQAKRLIDQGAIGRPMFMTSFILGNEIDRMNDPDHWKGDREKSGGGVLIDSGIHHIDLMRFLLGEAAGVSAVTKRFMVKPAHKEEDSAFVTIEFENGAVGTLAASYAMTELPWTEPKTIYGTEGTLVIDDSGASPLTLVKAARKAVCDDGFVRCQAIERSAVAVPTVPTDNDNPLWYYSIGRCLDDFIDALLRDRQPAVAFEDGQAALAVVVAAYQSQKSGTRVTL